MNLLLQSFLIQHLIAFVLLGWCGLALIGMLFVAGGNRKVMPTRDENPNHNFRKAA